jgi:asparagine synthase (glutamine-hydrolysing)
VAFAEREANEFGFARTVATAFRTDHHEVVVSPEEFFEALPTLVWHEDEPLAHPSSVALYFVAKLATERVKVVLTGEGSDEMLAGYGRYARTLYNVQWGVPYHRFVPAGIRHGVRRSIGLLAPGSLVRRKLQRTFLCLPPDLESLYFENFAVFTRARQTELLTPAAKERVGTADPYRVMRDWLERSDAGTLLDRILYVDGKTYLQELLMKQDQMSMAASIESRVPFLDHHLVEFAARLPSRLKLRGFTTKRILRESMKRVLPPSILARRKMGFPVPVGQWLRGRFEPIVEEFITGPRPRDRELFDPTFVRQMVEEHQTGRASHGARLWSLINLEIWQRIFIDGEGAESIMTPVNRRALAA